MLVLSRKSNEQLMIGDKIEVVVLEVRKNRVKLGFRCAPEISIRRDEAPVLTAGETAPLQHPLRSK